MYQNLKTKIEDRKLSAWTPWGDTHVRNVLDYYETHIAPLESIWDEATLLAALQFIRNELGIYRVYYHTWETGNWFKRIDSDWSPPKSIYTALPKKFGFKRAGIGPNFIIRDKTNRRRLRPFYQGRQKHSWWYTDLSEVA